MSTNFDGAAGQEIRRSGQKRSGCLRGTLPFLFSLRRPVTWRSRLERPPPLFFLPLTRGEGIRFVAVLLLRCAEIEFSSFLETKDSETRSAMDLLHCLSCVVAASEQSLRSKAF